MTKALRSLISVFTCVSCASCVLLWTSCSTPPPPHELTPEEQSREDTKTGDELSRQFENKLSLKKDIEIAVYLRKIGLKLSDQVPELRSKPLGIFIVQDRDNDWKNYALPGNRIYVSLGLLKNLELENEVASTLAFELAHVVNRWAVQRLEVIKAGGLSSALDYFSASGVFSFTDASCLESAEEAVRILYLAGYDPRGLVALWKKYRANKEHSPFSAELLDRLEEKTRETVAQLAPLRNPIVRTEAFVSLRKRIERL